MPFDKNGKWVPPSGEWATPFQPPQAAAPKIDNSSADLDILKNLLNLGRTPFDPIPSSPLMQPKSYANEAMDMMAKLKEQKPALAPTPAIPAITPPAVTPPPAAPQPQKSNRLGPGDHEYDWWSTNPFKRAIRDNLILPFSNAVNDFNDTTVGKVVGRAGQNAAERATFTTLPEDMKVKTGSDTLDQIADVAGYAGLLVDPAAVTGKAAGGVLGAVDDAAKGPLSKMGSAITNKAGTVGKNGMLTPAALQAEQTAVDTIGKQGAKMIALGGAEDYLKGATTPDLYDRNLMQTVGANMTAGTGDTMETLGSAAKWLGFEHLGNDLQQEAIRTRQGFETKQKDFSWKSFLDPEFYASNVARSIPTSLSLMPLALIGSEAGALTAGAVGLGSFGRTILQSIGASAFATPMEAAMEAGGVYEDMRKQGKSKEEADKAAQKTFLGNAALLAFSNSLEFGTMFAPKGISSVLDSGAGRLATGITTSAGEEGAQEVISRNAKGEKIAFDKDMQEQMAIGGIMGAGFGAVGSVNESHDAMESIQHRVIQKLSDQDKVDLNEAMDEAKAMGIPQEEAMKHVMNAIADDPKGKQHIEEAVKEVLESEGVKQATKQAPQQTDDIQVGEASRQNKRLFSYASSDAAAAQDVAPHVEDFQMPTAMPLDEMSALLDGQKPPSEPVSDQATKSPKKTAAPKNGQVEALSVGDTVNLKGKGEQKFTVTGINGKFVSLESENGGKIPQVHQKALIRTAETAEIPSNFKPYWDNVLAGQEKELARLQSHDNELAPAMARELESMIQKTKDIIAKDPNTDPRSLERPEVTDESEKKGNVAAEAHKFIAGQGIENFKPTHTYNGVPVEVKEYPEIGKAAYRYQTPQRHLPTGKRGGLINLNDAEGMKKLGSIEEEVSGDDKKRIEAEQAYSKMTQKIAGSGNLTTKTKIKLLQEMKSFAGENGLTFSDRHQQLLDRFTGEVESSEKAKKDYNKMAEMLGKGYGNLTTRAKVEVLERMKTHAEENNLKFSPRHQQMLDQFKAEVESEPKITLKSKELVDFLRPVKEGGISDFKPTHTYEGVPVEAKEIDGKMVYRYQNPQEYGRTGGGIALDDTKGLEKLVPIDKPSDNAGQNEGKTVTVTTERGTKISVKYAVVNGMELIPSNNPITLKPNLDFPQDLQPRDRSRSSSEEQINRIATKLQPELLGASPKASDGAPIVSDDLVVESGNGRIMALQRAHMQNYKSAEAYKAWLKENLDSFGISASALIGNPFPVLVRIRQTPMTMAERANFAVEANEQTVNSMSATEQAKADADKLTPAMIDMFDPGEDANIMAASNRDFVRAFMGNIVSPSDRARFTDKNGDLNQDGVSRIRNAVFYRTYGDTAAIEKLAESTDNNVRNITAAMLVSAPNLVRVKEDVAQGKLHDLDITGDIAAAMVKMSSLRDEGQTVEYYLGQGDLFGEDLSNEAKNILVLFDANKRSKNKIVAVLNAYAEIAELAGDPNQLSMFDFGAVPTKLETLEAAIRKVDEGDGNQITLWTNAEIRGDGASETGGTEQESAQKVDKTIRSGDRIMETAFTDRRGTYMERDGEKFIQYDDGKTGKISSLFGYVKVTGDIKLSKPIKEYDEFDLTQEVIDTIVSRHPDLADVLKNGSKNEGIQAFKRTVDGIALEGDEVTVFGRFDHGPDQQTILSIDSPLTGTPIRITNFRDMIEQHVHKTIPKPEPVTEENVIKPGEMIIIKDDTGREFEVEFVGRPPGTSLIAFKYNGKTSVTRYDRVVQREEGTNAKQTDSVGRTGEETLDGTPADNVPAAANAGETGGSAVRSPGADEGRGTRNDAAGDEPSGGMGSSETDVDTASGRGNDAEPSKQSSNMERTRQRVKAPSSSNYVITTDDLNMKGAKTSFRSNVNAIKLMKQIMAEGRPATAEEQKVLVQYVGWGGIKEPFEVAYRVKDEWKKEHAELKELLTPEEWEKAADTVLNAHYTSKEVITAMYQGLQQLGFTGGRVLEPSMGAGHFVGLMPKEMAKNSSVSGVELDTVTGNIAKLLYPRSDVRVQGFEETKMADNFYDVAIGNVPFASFGVADMAYKGTPVYNASLHDYFFAKALDKVRPGGVVMFLTSRYTMDAKNSKMRRYFASKADLIGAIRLPNTAFKKSAGTEVVTDLLILQKRAEGTAAAGQANWMETKHLPNSSIEVNAYFADHPEMVLGEFDQGGMYRANDLTVKPTGDLQKQLAKALSSFPSSIISKVEHTSTEAASPRDLVPAPGHVKENAYVVHGDVVHVNKDGRMEPIGNLGKATAERIKGMVKVRDAVRDYLRLQLSDSVPESAVEASRKRLNQVYDAFVKQHGYINDPANARAFIDDPDAYLMLSLENYNKDTKTAEKADIFTKRTVQRYKPAESAGTSKEALVISLNERGRVDLDHMAQLTGKSVDEVAGELEGHIYNDPTKGWVTSDEYLSGNVKEKLAAAQTAAALDPTYQANVAALEAVQPVDLVKEEIDVKLGSHWVDPDYVRDFVSRLAGVRSDWIKVKYNQTLAEWVVEYANEAARSRVKTSTDANVTWGTADYNAVSLIEQTLNFKTPKVIRTTKDGEGREIRVVDQKATVAAREKQNAIKEEFTRWIWEDPKRQQTLVQTYNDRFNTDRLRAFDGQHMTFPGMNPAITLKAHQKDAVWRALQNGNTLFAHAVGAGKTYEMIATMMELKRTGIVNKPMWVVPNHLVEQMGSDFMKLYPAANILVAGKKDFEAKNRKKLFAKIATGNYDAVIVPHSSFGKISMSKETVQEFYQVQLDQLAMAMEEEALSGTRKDTALGKRIRAARKSLTERMNKQVQKIEKDDNVNFEELGVDGLVVDEAHEFKNLFYTTKLSRVAGLGTAEGSGKAFDLFMKTRYLQQLNNGRGIVYATGTPVSNSLAEMYTFQRYLQYDELERRGIHNFDAWVSQFGDVKNVLELSPEGKGLRMRTRLSEVVNLPELLHMFRSFADVKTADELLKAKLITRPELKGGQRTPVVIPATDELRSFVQDLADRAEAIRTGKVKPEEDNMLAVVGAGRKAALDMRLVDPNAKDHPDSKVNIAADKIAEIHKATKKYKNKAGETITNGAQLVFLDLSTPVAEKIDKDGNTVQGDDPESSENVSIYNELRQKLIKKGIPAKEIAFIHDYPKDAQKEELFRKVNNGEIRILIGSTAKMGAGMNVQTRLAALHHLDVPWRPSDIEQREGRILRQGNMNDEVDVFAYMTEESFDAYMWQTIANKAKVVDQTMSGDLKTRRVEDPSGMEMSANELKALASGDPRIMELANLDKDVSEMDYKRQATIDQLKGVRSSIRNAPVEIERAERTLESLKKDLQTRQDTKGDKFKLQLGKKLFTDRKDAGRAVNDAVMGLDLTGDETKIIGKFAGFELEAFAPSSLIDETPKLYIKGDSRLYSVSVSESEMGTIRSMENAIASIDDRIKQTQERIDDANVQLEKMRQQETRLAGEVEKINVSFNEKLARKENLENELNIDRKADEDGADGSESDDTAETAAPAEPAKNSQYERAIAVLAKYDLTPAAIANEKSALAKEARKMLELGKIVDRSTSQKARSDFEQAVQSFNQEAELVRSGKSRMDQMADNVTKGKTDQSLGFIPNASRQKQSSNPFAVDNEEIERRMQNARLQKPSFMLRMNEVFDAFKRKLRDFEYLPKTPQFEPLRQKLLQLNNQRDVANFKTFQIMLQDIVLKLDKAEYELFSRKVIIDDQYQELKRGNALNFGFDEEELLKYKEKLDSQLEAHPEVKRSIEKRNKAWEFIKDHYFKAMGDIGVNVQDKLIREDYFRHQVIAYAQEDAKRSTSPRKIRTPNNRGFLRTRTGEYTGDINTDYLQAESEVMVQMLFDTEKARVIKLVDDMYNKAKEFKALANQQNMDALQEAFAKEKESLDADFSPLEATYKEFNKNMAIGFSQLKQIHDLWTGENGEYAQVAKKLGNHNDIDIEYESSERDADTFKYLSELAQTEEPGAIQAAMILKNVAQRKKFVKETIGKKFKTWESIVEKSGTHVLWQPAEGSVFYKTNPGADANDLFSSIMASIGVDPKVMDEVAERLNDSIGKPIIALGGKRKQFAIPAEVADTLDSVMAKENNGAFVRTMHAITSVFKKIALTGPRSFVKYNLRNVTSDLDKLVAGNPAAMKKLFRAARELAGVYFKESGGTPELREYIQRGGLQNLQQVQEAGDIGQLKMFMRFYDKSYNRLNPLHQMKTAWNLYWRWARKANDYREAIARYAVYLDYLEQLENSKNDKPKNYGSSRRELVDALPDNRDKAFKLSNELLVDYNATSTIGREISDLGVYPFFRWVEGNIKSSTMLFVNAHKDGVLAAAVGRKVLGKAAVRTPYYAYRMGRLTLQMSALSALIMLWNKTMYPDQEEELPESVRNSLHLIYGVDKNGKTRYLDRLGFLQDYLEWFGIDDADKNVRDILDGKKSIQDVATDMWHKPVNKVAQGIGPLIKFPTETFTGTSLFPDAFHPSANHDWSDPLLNLFGLKKDFDAVTRKLHGVPGKPFDVLDFVSLGSDPREAAYYELRDLMNKYKKDNGIYVFQGGGDSTPKSNALYNYKMAVRYGDTVAQDKYVLDYVMAGGKVSGIADSLKNLDPLSSLSKKNKAGFIASLKPDQEKILDRAYEFYTDVLLGPDTSK